jgi:hypothetical protein
MLADGQALQSLGKSRRAADEKRAAMQAASQTAVLAHASEFAKSDWQNAANHAQRAAEAYGFADFAKAAEHWNNAAAAYSAAAETAKKTGLPRLQAIALHTSLAVNNKWWHERVRPQPAASGGLNGFGLPPPVAPGIRTFGGSGIPSARPAPKDWPPNQAAVSQGMTFLELEAKERLGIDPALIDRLITVSDNAILDATSSKVVDQITAEHGEHVNMAYRLGTNLVKFKVMCELGLKEASSSFGGSGLLVPGRGDIFWSSDYILHRATVCGLPAEFIDEMKEIRRIFDASSDGMHNEYATELAYLQMHSRFSRLYEQHFSSVEATTALFARAQPPADPPEFPTREEAVEELMLELEKKGAWFLLDIDRWDRPPVSLVFAPERRFGAYDVDLNDFVDKIVRLNHLRTLHARHYGFTDAHIAKLAELKELRGLCLSCDKLTEAGFAELTKLPHLESLSFFDGVPSEAAIKPLAGLKLQELAIFGENMGDEGAKTIAQIRTLTALNLEQTSVTDQGVKYLQSLPKLAYLNLEKSKLTDAGAAHLAELPSLENLSVRDTPLTDAAVPELKKLKNLKAINLDDTQITKEGAAELKAALPDCAVRGP